MTMPADVHEVVLGGRTFAIAAAPLADGGRVVAGSPLQPVEGPLADLARLFAVVGLVSAAASGGLGWWLAGRALRPVVGLTDATRELDPADLERRLPMPPRSDELGRLAATMNGLLERTSATISRQRLFVAAASHDLRTPIATLQAELELADDERSTRQELLTAVRAARADLASLTNLAAALLELAAAEPGGRPLVRSEVDLEALIASCLRRVAPVARQKSVLVEAATPHMTIRVDRVRMEQALTNLLMNAVTHGGAGGQVDVWAAVDSGPGRTGKVSIEVLDRGPGVPPEAASRIFEPYERNGEGGAVGLGLATAAGAVRAHGGEIGVRPRAGGGSRFWLTVPLEPPA
jgi:signal transduction histidine kinase